MRADIEHGDGRMRTIDIETWPRRRHFELFSTWAHPHFNMSAHVDVAPLHAAAKRRGVSFTVAVVYAITRAANDIPEFRYRIRGAEVVEHDTVHPSITVMGEDDLFMHPLGTHPPDSVPRFAWGRFYEQDAALKMPLSVQGHHALMDGVHVGAYYELVQRYLAEPESYMDAG